MKTKDSKQRIYAALMMLGASILLFRTVRMMLIEDAFEILVLWVNVLLIAEFIIDLGCTLWSVRWFITAKKENARLPLQFGAIATMLHAIRVLIYVLGRTGPCLYFDVKPEYRSSYTFEWFWVYFAGVLSILGIVGLVVIWQIIRKKEKKHTQENNKKAPQAHIGNQEDKHKN